MLLAGTSNKVQGNFIGVNAAGTAALFNAGNGVSLQGNDNQVLGGFTPLSRQVISGNTQGGVRIDGDGNSLTGNTIGTNATGTAAIANGVDGVSLLIGADSNIIGSLAVGKGNLISGNIFDGVDVAGNFNQVLGNFIGVNGAGTAALANGGNGVVLTGNNNQVLGRLTGGQRQVISGNAQSGVAITGTDNLIAENIIGLDVTATIPIPNGAGDINDAGTNTRIFNNLT